MSLDSLCRWQVRVSVYCAWRIPAHLRCTQCSILLHLMEICFLTCICLWQISQIQTFLFRVVGPGLVSTSPAFVSNSASHPAIRCLRPLFQFHLFISFMDLHYIIHSTFTVSFSSLHFSSLFPFCFSFLNSFPTLLMFLSRHILL